VNRTTALNSMQDPSGVM